MKIRIYSLIILFFFSLSTTIIAQQDSLLEVKSNYWTGTKYYQNGNALKTAQVKQLLSTNDLASKTFKQGKSLQNIAIVPSIAGGAFIGWPLGGLIAGKSDTKTYFFAIGGGLILGSILLASAGTKKIKAAIDIFNNQYSTTLHEKQPKMELRMVSNQNGVGFKLSF